LPQILCGSAIVIPQQAAETFAACDVTVDAADLADWLDQPVAEALVIAFSMKTGQILTDGFA
jgi:hypothetical protein